MSIKRKLFASYLCVLLPAIIVNVFLFQCMIRSLDTAIRDRLVFSLSQTSQSMTRTFDDYKNSAMILAAEPEIEPKYMLASAQNAHEGIAVLKKVRAYSHEASVLFVYYQDERVYTNQGLTRERTFYECTCRLPEPAFPAMKEALECKQDTARLFPTVNGCVILYHYPIRERSGGYYSINYLFDIQDIPLQNLVSIIGDEHTYIQITDESSAEYCFHINLDGAVTRVDAAEICMDNYVDCYVDMLNIRLRLLFRKNVVFRNTFIWQLVFLGVESLLILMMLAVSYRQTLEHFRPFYRFAQTLHLANGRRDASTEIEGYDEIQQSLESFIDTVEEKQVLSQRQLSMFRQQVAGFLFRSTPQEETAANTLFALSGVERNEIYYTIICLRFRDHQAPRKMKDILNGKLYEMSNDGETYVLSMLMELPTNDVSKEIRRQYAQRMLDICGADALASCSHVYQSTRQISDAYSEARMAMEDLQNAENECVSFIGETTNEERFESALSAFEMWIQKERLSEVLSQLNEIEAAIQPDLPRNTCRLIKQRIVRSMVTEIIRRFKESEAHELMMDTLSLLSCEDMQFWPQTRQILTRIFSNSANSAKFKQALEYIQKHFDQGDLSLEQVADYVGFSRPQLSRLMKSNMGISYIEYVTNLRMERANALLCETSLTVHEIALSVGFVDLQWFYKKYRERYHESPGNAREIAKLPHDGS